MTTTTVAGTPLAENALTRDLLADVGSIDTAAPAFGGTHAWLGRPIFNRPALLEADTAASLGRDLRVFLGVLRALPDRLFDGDPAALARALGLPEAQAAASDVSARELPSIGRADLVQDATGFRLVEFNTSSSLGGCEIAEMNRAMLADPAFAAFAARHDLTYRDPIAGMLRTFPPSEHPIAVLTWPGGSHDHLTLFLASLAAAGHEAFACRAGELAYQGGVLTAGGRRVDRVFRTFQLGRLDGSPEADALVRPLLRAADDGAATLLAPFAADLYGIKECLALLAEDACRQALTADEREVVDRLLPWTRRLDRSLLDHAREHRKELVLKPSTGYAGRGITAGWMVDPATWSERLEAALSAPHVVQRRVRPVAERFLDADGRAAPCLLSWGVFLTDGDYGGAFVKGIPGAGQDIRFLGDGSYVGCVFHREAR
ncbi:hypothetical protein AB0H63_17215 [Micromonospora echinospora]|uniref:hypothetical protein n=1 Tax=Micromonospora echinospora TaxID=1877 RepID=UPI003404624F